MDLIFYNCELYNGTVSEVGKHGVLVKKVWLSAWKDSGLDTGGVSSFVWFVVACATQLHISLNTQIHACMKTCHALLQRHVSRTEVHV